MHEADIVDNKREGPVGSWLISKAAFKGSPTSKIYKQKSMAAYSIALALAWSAAFYYINYKSNISNVVITKIMKSLRGFWEGTLPEEPTLVEAHFSQVLCTKLQSINTATVTEGRRLCFWDWERSRNLSTPYPRSRVFT